MSNYAKHLVSSLPYYVTNGSEQDLVNAVNDLIKIVHVITTEQQSAEDIIRQAWQETDILSYVEEAMQNSTMMADLSDLAMDYGRLRQDFDHVMRTATGPQGLKGERGDQGDEGAMGPSGVESDEFQAFIERMKDMEDRINELAQAVDELEDK